MHPRVMVERTAAAQARIANAAQQIGARLDLDAQVVALANANNRDAEIALLQQREAIADLLEAVVAKLDAPTDEVELPESDAPTDEVETEVVNASRRKGRSDAVRPHKN